MKDKVLTFIAILAIAGGACLDARAAIGGNGTETDPFTINSKADWDEVVNSSSAYGNLHEEYYKITADLSGLTNGLGGFYGHLDGDGHTITFENVFSGFTGTSCRAKIENLEVRGTLRTKYIFGTGSIISLNNCIVNLTTTSSEQPVLFNDTGDCDLNKSILRFANIAFVNSGGDGGSKSRVYVVTLDPGVRSERSGGTPICNGKGIVYDDGDGSGTGKGFRTAGIEGFEKGKDVFIVLQGIKIENYTISGTDAEKVDDSTIVFTMPDNTVNLSITEKSITYVNNVSGVETIKDFTLLDEFGTTVYPAGTYVVSGDLAIGHRISFGGNSTIIVADDCTFSIGNGADNTITNVIHADGSLNISGQEEGTGLVDIDMAGVQTGDASQTSTFSCIDAAGDVKVNDCGVNVKLKGTVMSSGMSDIDIVGIRAGNNVSFDNVGFKASYDGVDENSKFHDTAIHAGGSITFTGCQVEATCTSHGTSMVAGDGKFINVDWRYGNDTFLVTRYSGTLNILNDKYFHNGSKGLTGEITNTGDVNTKRLTPAIDLWDGGVNSDRIDQYDGVDFNFFLDDRTLFKDGAWNTLTLPFSLDESETAALLDGNGYLMALDTETVVDGHKTGLDGGVLYLNFAEARAITAGRPYIIRWTGGDNLVEPLFEGVTISKGGPQPVTFSGGSFVGNYDEVKVAEGDAFCYIILAGDNKIGYSAVGSTLHNFRAHFEILDATEVKACQLSFGEAGTTGIIPIKAEHAAQGIYSLDGLRLESIPARKGIYIKDGKKVMVAD